MLCFFAGVDTDKYKYPIGSGRVTFNNHKSYMKAVAAAFIEIRAQRFTKKVNKFELWSVINIFSVGIRKPDVSGFLNGRPWFGFQIVLKQDDCQNTSLGYFKYTKYFFFLC